MSAQGGSLNGPIHVPTRPLVAGVAALLLALAIGFGISQLGHEPTAGFGATVDVPMNGFGRIPEQRLHPIGFGGAPADISLPEPPSLVWARAGGPRPLEP